MYITRVFNRTCLTRYMERGSRRPSRSKLFWSFAFILVTIPFPCKKYLYRTFFLPAAGLLLQLSDCGCKTRRFRSCEIPCIFSPTTLFLSLSLIHPSVPTPIRGDLIPHLKSSSDLLCPYAICAKTCISALRVTSAARLHLIGRCTYFKNLHGNLLLDPLTFGNSIEVKNNQGRTMEDL